jgi:hypothetical protein
MFVDLLSSSTLKRAIGIPLATTYQFSSFRALLSFLMSSMQESQSPIMRFLKLRQLTITFRTPVHVKISADNNQYLECPTNTA